MKKKILLITTLILSFGCSDDEPASLIGQGGDIRPGLAVSDAQLPDASPDYAFILPNDASVDQPDQLIDICNGVTNLDHESYCSCKPDH